MHLERIRWEGVRNLADREIALSDGGTPVSDVVITGEAGAGKTTVLEAVLAVRSAHLGMPPPKAQWLSPKKSSGAIELGWKLSAIERQAARLDDSTLSIRWDLDDSSSPEPIPLRVRELLASVRCEYFDAIRSLSLQREEAVPAPTDPSRTRRRPGKYAWVRSYILHCARRDARAALSRVQLKGIVLAGSLAGSLDGFGRTLAAIQSGLRWVGVRAGSGGAEECAFVRADGTEPELGELSDSEQMAVLFAATFEALNLRGALVLVDSPELHIHPSMHATFFDRLCRLSAEGQLLTATSAPAILRAQPGDRVFVLDSR